MTSRNEINYNCDDDKQTHCVIFIALDTFYLIPFLL